MVFLSFLLLTHGPFQLEALAQTTCVNATAGSAEDKGCWSDTLAGWPLVAIHAHLLPDGRVIAWSRVEQGADDNATIWDPAFPWDFTGGADNSGTFTNAYFPVAHAGGSSGDHRTGCEGSPLYEQVRWVENLRGEVI